MLGGGALLCKVVMGPVLDSVTSEEKPEEFTWCYYSWCGLSVLCPPKFICGSLNFQCDGTWRWSHLEIGLNGETRLGPCDGISGYVSRGMCIWVAWVGGLRESTTFCKTKGELLEETKSARTLILDFQPSGLWEINFCCLSSLCMVFRYGSPSWLVHLLYQILLSISLGCCLLCLYICPHCDIMF